MKRIIALAVGFGLVASVVGAQELDVGFVRAITAAETQTDGVAVSARLVSVLGDSVYRVRSSEGETAYVNAESGRVSEVVEAVDDDPARRGGGARGDLGALLDAVDATIDWQRVIDVARDESERQDVHAVGLRFVGGQIAAHVAYGTPGPDESDLLVVAVDPGTYTVIDSVEPGRNRGVRRSGPQRGRGGPGAGRR